MGVHSGECFAHNIDSGDYIKSITVKHSTDAINVLEFMTSNGVEKSIGSDQTDASDEFDQTVTVVEFQEHERLQGGFAHVDRIRGEIRLMTIGFLTNDCFFEPEKPLVKPASNIVPQTTTIASTGSTTNNPFHMLPDLSTL